MYSQLYDRVIQWIPENARVLDLGTGDGAFLERLVQARRVRAEGVEQDAAAVARCIDRGLVVHHGDILNGLDQYAPGSFEYVLLLGSLQELLDPEQVVNEAFRVGKHVVISYSNFAHWRIRLQVLFRGRAPVTGALPQDWYRTRNTHFFSVLDFQEFCRARNLTQLQSAYFHRHGPVNLLPNLRAELALVLLAKAV
ncbi:MAG: methionine biosynthesis protein MetW [Verrucomicrobiota bacterium]